MKIATRIRILGPALVLGTACLIGVIAYWGGTALVGDLQRRALDAQVSAEAKRLTFALGEIQQDVLLLSQLPAVRGFSAAMMGEDTRERLEAWRAQVADIFASMLATKADYAQIRLIGVADGGRELIRVDRRGDAVVRIPAAGLQAKGQRDYFQATMAQNPGRIYVSDISLNREFGELEQPHRPMVRAGVPIHTDDGRPFGLVIINMDFDDFVARVLPRNKNDYDYYLSNAEGDYVLHPDPGQEFGFDLGRRYRIQDDVPGIAAIYAPSASRATAELSNAQRPGGGLMQASLIYPFMHEPDRFLVLALATSFEGINAAVTAIAIQMIGLTTLLLIVASLLAFTFARQIIQPLSRLTAAAQEIERSGRADFPSATRNDEIGTLVTALVRMVTALDEQREQLETANVDLEYFARIASHDLREPARRMALLANLLQMQEQEQERLDPESRDTLQRIRDEGLRMVEQLTDLRAFSRLGQAALQRETTDIRSLIEALLEEHRETLAERRIKVVVEPMPEVPVYRNLVELLYGNLVENALQHVETDGFVLMFTRKDLGDRVVFGVSNTGSTITGDPDIIFEAFRGTGDAQRHSGLGLAICRRIIERHAGQIWVEYDPHHVHFMFTFSENRN